MRIKQAIARLEALAASRREVQAEYDSRAANAAFDAALAVLPDGPRMARELARRLMNIPTTERWLDGSVNQYAGISREELMLRLEGPLAAMRAFRLRENRP